MVKILVPICDMCQGDDSDTEERGQFEKTITIDGEEYVVDLCAEHFKDWYQPLAALLDRVGVKTRLLRSRQKAKRPSMPAEPVSNELSPSPVELPEPDEPGDAIDLDRLCRFPACGAVLVSKERRNVHMRENHSDWYYSDEAAPYRGPGKLGEVHHCEICGAPKVGLQGLRAHQRSEHPDDYDRIMAEQQERERQGVLA